ncbi:hypothetical protein [Cellulomonas alba]|uniref:Uncharacterized protein n=1 Tax=Cellulomonas alba TaxID=3053467 RepID=A0ABT7SCJ6_9CELL|nr:hypothetical protein [Cellulomonas alba]MDM7853911.1 hypothetical protein [Cellulomonas alba]
MRPAGAPRRQHQGAAEHEEREGGQTGGARDGTPQIGLVFALVALPLAINTAFVYAVAVIDQRVERAAEAWLAGVEGAVLTQVSFSGSTIEVDVRVPGPLPDTSTLLDSLAGQVPSGTPLVVRLELADHVRRAVAPDP